MNDTGIDAEQLIEFMQVALDGLRKLAKDDPERNFNLPLQTLFTLFELAYSNPDATLAKYTRAAISAEIEAQS